MDSGALVWEILKESQLYLALFSCTSSVNHDDREFLFFFFNDKIEYRKGLEEILPKVISGISWAVLEPVQIFHPLNKFL